MARAVISSFISRGLSTSSRIAVGALSPRRLRNLCMRVYPPGREEYLDAKVSNILGRREVSKMNACARRTAGMSPFFPRVMICTMLAKSGHSAASRTHRTFSANRAASLALGRVVLICSC